MWQIYETTEYTNPDELYPETNIIYHPQVFLNYQDLALELSEICQRHQLCLDLYHNRTINNFRVGIPTLTELEDTPTGTNYQAYSISLDMGLHKIRGYIKKVI